jgi:cell division protein FtsI (penicillin-binding protein 3)
MANSHETATVRLKVIFGLFIVLTLCILGRFVQLQVVQHEHLKGMADRQHLRSVHIEAKRGNIYDRNGQNLAISVDVPSIAADPSLIQDPRPVAKALSKVLGADYESLYNRLSADTRFAWMQRRVRPETADKVRSLKLPGIFIRQEARRFYPNKNVASQVLGFTDIDGRGLEGVERSFEGKLKGQLQIIKTARDARGRPVLASGLDPEGRARGHDIRLTLDLNIQHVAEVALMKMIEETNAKSASAVVLDVESSEILAMATVPSFNPNKITGSKAGDRRNRALVDLFEPGSTMKPFVVAAALDEGAYNANDQLFCENGKMRVGGHTIRDYKPYGWMTLTQIIQKSSNICSAKIGQTLGNEKLHSTLSNLGFGRPTGISFPGETAGMLAAPSRWSASSSATISFGHGMASSLVQLAAAYRVLAAGGIYKTPTLIHSIEGPEGIEPHDQERQEKRIFDADAVAHTVKMMEAVVGEGGTGRLAAVPGYRVAGKTGTAQKIDPISGGYSDELFRAVFGGFLPARNPRVVIVVVVDEPIGKHTGGAVAGPVFSEIGSAAMLRLKVLPTLEQEPRPTSSVAGAIARINQLPSISTNPEPAREGIGEPRSGTIPSFMGLSARQSLARYQELGIENHLELVGSGAVVKQEPRVGTQFGDVDKVRLILGQR